MGEDSPMANAVADDGNDGGGGSRPPRQQKWSPQELRVLIQGKKAAETRGRTRPAIHMAPSPSEPKWVAVSSYCRRGGVDRSPRQCQKRWENLARDYKRIKVWECWRAGGARKESFWAMGNERRREWRLPWSFDRQVYAMLNGEVAPEPEPEPEGAPVRMGCAGPPPAAAEEEGAIFDSGRTAAEDGLFSDFEVEEVEEEEEEEGEKEEPPMPATPISERKPSPDILGPSESGMGGEEQPAKTTAKGSPSREAHKRKRPTSGEPREEQLQSQLMEILERNSRTLAAHLEAQNINWQLERDQRKDDTDRLVGVLGKLADALGRIADKLSLDGGAKV